MGNLLFPVCRAFLAAKKDEGVFIYPTWRQLKIGPYLRHEADKRTYGDIFKRRTFSDWLLLLKVSMISLRLFKHIAPFETIRHVGLGNYFYDLAEFRDEIKEFLYDMIKGELGDFKSDICIHVRKGDFAKNARFDIGSHNVQTQEAWYVEAVKYVLSNWDIENPTITIFSDGNVSDLKAKLANYGTVSVDKTDNAMEALVYLSRCEFFIGSRSSFSGWASYLSDAITIWPKDFEFYRYSPVKKGKDFSI
ncbi:alpha-1,2-fucosyltransferase [Amylibacter sp.]|nr:alpha-1,2-fucosyltransferase [Amylibacter sp.]